MAVDPSMADWQGPANEAYFAERSRRSAARAEPVPLHSPMPSELAERWTHVPAAALDKMTTPEATSEKMRRRVAWENASGGIKTLSWPEIIAQPPDPPPTIRPGVPKVGVTVLAGAPKAGKTLLASQWALESGRSTLLVIEEGSLAGISYRLRRQADALGIVDPQVHLAFEEQAPAGRSRGPETAPGLDRLGGRGDIWDRFRGASSIRSGTDANLVMDATGDTVHLVGEFRDAEPLSEWMELDRDTLTFRPTDAPEAVVKVDPTELRTFVEGRGQVIGKQVMDQFGVTKVTALRALRALGCDEYVGLRNTLTFSLGVR